MKRNYEDMKKFKDSELLSLDNFQSLTEEELLNKVNKEDKLGITIENKIRYVMLSEEKLEGLRKESYYLEKLIQEKKTILDEQLLLNSKKEDS